MSFQGKVKPLSPNNRNSTDNSEVFVLSSFKLKPGGYGGTKNTLVENDSLSSYSWPEETIRKNGESQQSEENSTGATQDCSLGSTISNLSGKGHVVIDIDDFQDADSTQKSYVEAYLKLMYWMCVSPFCPTKNLGENTTAWYTTGLNFSQKICFTVFIAMSLLDSFFLVKYFVFFNLKFGGLENFVDMMFFIMMLVTKLYYVYVFLRRQQKFRQMLISRQKLLPLRNANQQANQGHFTTMTYAIILGLISVLVSVSITTWPEGLTNWKPQQTVLFHSNSFAMGLFLWTQEQLNDTCLDAIEEQYGKHLTTTNFLFGLIGLIIQLCSSIHMETVANLMFTNSKTLKLELGEMRTKISNPNNDAKNITLAEFFAEGGEWAHFQMIKHAVNNDNDALDSLMKFEHVYNMMLFVFFALNLFDSDFGWVYKAHLLYKIIKASYTYRLAAKAASLNESAKDWIQRLAWKTTDKLFLERVPLLLYELEKRPIGMGRGQFLVDESFLYRFLGMVGSVFVLEADAKD